MPLEFTPIASSNMDGCAYDPEARELHVRFHIGTVHAYADVSPEEHEAFMAAPSKGQHLARVIKPAKASRKVAQP